MKKELVLVGGAVVLTAALMWEFMPKRTVEKIIPNIITQHDTVSVDKLPDWYTDSVKKWKKRIHTTDTINIYVTNTIIRSDTIKQFVYVGSDTSKRPNLWPVISYHGGSRFGDTAIVTTFSLRAGIGSVSRVFIPGILTAIDVDSGKPYPSLTYVPFPKPKSPSLFYKVKMIAIGYGSCLLVNSVR